MTNRAHVVAIVATLVVVAVILRLVRLQQLRSKYALLWLTIAVLLLPLAAFPTLTDELADWAGISDGRTLFLLAAVGFLFLVVVHFSWELSRLEMRSRVLAEELALLQQRVAEQGHSATGDHERPDSSEATAAEAGEGPAEHAG